MAWLCAERQSAVHSFSPFGLANSCHCGQSSVARRWGMVRLALRAAVHGVTPKSRTWNPRGLSTRPGRRARLRVSPKPGFANLILCSGTSARPRKSGGLKGAQIRWCPTRAKRPPREARPGRVSRCRTERFRSGARLCPSRRRRVFKPGAPEVPSDFGCLRGLGRSGVPWRGAPSPGAVRLRGAGGAGSPPGFAGRPPEAVRTASSERISRACFGMPAGVSHRGWGPYRCCCYRRLNGKGTRFCVV